jgi:ATP-binding protein involved in chromosome partitioning
VDAIHSLVDPDLDIIIDMTSKVTSIRDDSPVLPQVKNIIAIASGKGGVGKSTVTVNMALAMAKAGAKVGLIDADIYGPSIPTMLGMEGAKPGLKPVDGKNKIIPIEKFGIHVLSIGFLTPTDQAVVWRGPMASSALRQFFTDTLWPELDYLFIDLPPGTSDIHLTMVQTVPVTGAVIVTTPQKVALDDAQKGLMMFKQREINVPVLGLIENMAYFTPPDLPEKKYHIFGQGGGKRMAERYEVPFLGELPLEEHVREAGDSGTPVVLDPDREHVIEDIAGTLARSIAIRNSEMPNTARVRLNTE